MRMTGHIRDDLEPTSGESQTKPYIHKGIHLEIGGGGIEIHLKHGTTMLLAAWFLFS